MPSPLRAVLFDRDDTLAQTDRAVYAQAAAWLASRYGLEAGQVGQTLMQLWQEQGPLWWDIRSHEEEEAYWSGYGEMLAARLALSQEAVSAFVEQFPYERYLKAVPDAREVLSSLRAQGYKIGVLSNTFPSIDRTLAAIGIADLVDVALATCLLGVHKPEQQAFALAAEALGLPPQQILFIDDRPENIEAARQFGMRAELIDLRGQTAGALHGLREVSRLVQAQAAQPC